MPPASYFSEPTNGERLAIKAWAAIISERQCELSSIGRLIAVTK